MKDTVRKSFSRIALACVLALSCALPSFVYANEAEDQAIVASFSVVEPSKTDDDSVENVLVLLDDAGTEETDSSSAEPGISAIESVGGEVVDEIAEATEDTGTILEVAVPEEASLDATLEQLNEMPEVDYAQPNYAYSLLEETSEEALAASANVELRAATNDPSLSSQYYLKDRKVYGSNAFGAWNYAKAAGKVTVAVLDTGANTTHPDLKNNLVTEYMWDAFHKDSLVSKTVPRGDNNGHGTHVSGVIGAVANNGRGIAGVSYNAKILPIKVFNDHASVPLAWTSTLVEAYSYLFELVKQGKLSDLRVINMSLGRYGTDKDDVLFKKYIDEALNKYGIISVGAGGNGDANGNPRTDPSYPSDFNTCVSVTALNTDGTHAAWSDYNKLKDISAPGVEVLSTYKDGSYGYLSGSSMAAPVVSGAMALLWAQNPSYTATQVKTALYQTTDLIPNNARAKTSGSKGALDIKSALAYYGTSAVDMNTVSVAAVNNESFTGHPFKPAIKTPNYQGKQLQSGRDYAVRYGENTQVGTGTVEVVGKGKYSSGKVVSFNIDYTDVSRNKKRWYNDYVYAALADGLMSGYTDGNGTLTGEFGPEHTITRGQVATILYRYANPTSKKTLSPASYEKNKTKFKDNANKIYYTAAVNWAQKKGILKGDDATKRKTVRPDDSITRQELATVLARYVKSTGANTKASSKAFKKTTDWKKVAPWAEQALIWTSAHGILGGIDNGNGTYTLAPEGYATRSQMAKMIVVMVRDAL